VRLVWSAVARRRCLPHELARACCNPSLWAGLFRYVRVEPNCCERALRVGTPQFSALIRIVLRRHPRKAAGASPVEAKAGPSSRSPHHRSPRLHAWRSTGQHFGGGSLSSWSDDFRISLSSLGLECAARGHSTWRQGTSRATDRGIHAGAGIVSSIRIHGGRVAR
jgi:hypothetical protein